MSRGPEGFPDTLLSFTCPCCLAAVLAYFCRGLVNEEGVCRPVIHDGSKGHPVNTVHLKGQLKTREDKFPGGK